MSTLMADLVRRQTASAVFSVLGRTVDKVAEEMALDLLRDPETREQLRTLVRAAFDKALVELQSEAPPEPTREDWRSALQRIDAQIAELQRKRSEGA